MTHKIAIIGAGFSGAATAIHLLTRHGDKPLKITLINRHANLARGVAYGTHSPSHLLNVPAGRMSLFPDRENDFLEFARGLDSSITASSFVPRSLYGRYLGARLRQAVDNAPRARLEPLTGEVVDLKLASGGQQAKLQLADGSVLTIERVVLAVGNYPPADPSVPDAAFFKSPQYVRDPWAPGALDGQPLEQPLLLLGTGLTMMDVALELARRGFSSTLFALSRRGLLPQAHRELSAMPTENALPADLMRGPASTRRYLRTLRRHIRTLAAQGTDWRDVIGSLRLVTPALWQALDLAERRRFLRHAQPYWDTHRHRTAPAAAAQLEALRHSGRLMVRAGRLQHVNANRGQVEATWQPRNSSVYRQLSIAAVINCTGPQSALEKLPDPLI
ncbi:MAG: FAD/NAD(P)-binding protein, partial [Gammaproteobacteria bacterium]